MVYLQYEAPCQMVFKLKAMLRFRAIDRQTDRQTDKQTDRQTDRHTDRQTDRTEYVASIALNVRHVLAFLYFSTDYFFFPMVAISETYL